MKKVLVAIDGSECAFRAVEYVGRQFSGADDLEITLLHVIPYPPAPLWDDGHILSKEEKEAREKVIDTWLNNQRVQTEPLFKRAVEILSREGVKPYQIEKKSISDSIDVAGSILEEAGDGGYQTLVLGRCGLSPAGKFLAGSVTMKIVTHGAGIAICLVE
jgi:nucleotide-binding universal stress UspA family protein